MKYILNATSWLSTHRAVTGFATLIGTIIGIIAALRSEDTIIQLSGVAIIAFVVMTIFIVFRQHFTIFARWLTWKFSFGFTLGVVTIIMLYSFGLNNFRMPLLPNQRGYVELTHTIPKSNTLLDNANDRIAVYFSEEMSIIQRRGVKVAITPPYPIDWYWLIPVHSDSTRQLIIEPIKYYPKEKIPRFNYGMEYKLEIKGGPLKDKIIVMFKTPEKKME